MSEGQFLFWIAAGFAAVCCAGMYLVTRWTKPPRDPYAQIARQFYDEGAERARRKMRERFEAPRPRLGADEVLRRHLHSTRPERKTREPS